MCTLWCFYMCICVAVCALASLSHMCGACAVSRLGWGRRRSPETAEHKGETQAGRQTGSLPERLGPRTAQGGGGGPQA